MTEGYAFVACPAKYVDTNPWTYMISSAGTIYDCDLGTDTLKIVERMTAHEHAGDLFFVVE